MFVLEWPTETVQTVSLGLILSISRGVEGGRAISYVAPPLCDIGVSIACFVISAVNQAFLRKVLALVF